jgi:hypothetical protein
LSALNLYSLLTRPLSSPSASPVKTYHFPQQQHNNTKPNTLLRNMSPEDLSTLKLQILTTLSTPPAKAPDAVPAPQSLKAPPPSTIKSNKLRKLLLEKTLKSLKLTWNDYKEACDLLVAEGKIVESDKGGEGGGLLSIAKGVKAPKAPKRRYPNN